MRIGYMWRGAVVAVVATLMVAAPAAATQPQATTFALDGHFTGPNTIEGTWTATGVVNDAGSYTETFWFAGETVHVEKLLTGSRGTIILRVNTVVEWISPCTAIFRAGAWQIAGQTGTYERLTGGGTPAAEAAGYGDVCTGEIHLLHEGQAHID